MFFVPSGVGQGSILGPIFFMVFFNDLDPKSNVVSSINFADDRKIDKYGNKCTSSIQAEINEFITWCRTNNLEVSSSKRNARCNVISYSMKRNIVQHEYAVNGIKNNRVNEVGDLGMIIDNKLNFIKQI